MTTCVIFNPAARGDKARRLQAHLTEISRQAALKPTQGPGDARHLGAAAVREGFTTIVAAGGDGTLNEVLNGLADADGLGQARRGVLPLGTVNVFAKELNLPHDFASAWATIERGEERRIDLPWAEFRGAGSVERRHFAQLAGAGLDSRAVELVSWSLKKRLGPLAYVVAGIRALSEDQPPIEISNGTQTARGQLVLIGNGRFYGGRFPIFPRADLSDGVLEAVVYPSLGVETLAHAGWGVLAGDFHTGSQTIQLQGTRLELKCAGTIPLQLDGESVGHLPATLGIRPNALRVIVA